MTTIKFRSSKFEHLVQKKKKATVRFASKSDYCANNQICFGCQHTHVHTKERHKERDTDQGVKEKRRK